MFYEHPYVLKQTQVAENSMIPFHAFFLWVYAGIFFSKTTWVWPGYVFDLETGTWICAPGFAGEAAWSLRCSDAMFS